MVNEETSGRLKSWQNREIARATSGVPSAVLKRVSNSALHAGVTVHRTKELMMHDDSSDAWVEDPARTVSPERPMLKPGVERCRIGSSTVFTCDGQIHLALEEHEVAMLDDFDGTTDCTQLVERHGAGVGELVHDLAAAGFLAGTPAFVARPLMVSRDGIEFSGFDRVVAAVDSAIGSHLARKTSLVVAGFASLCGLAALFNSPSKDATYSATATLAVLAVWAIVSAIPHEMAHALVLHRAGRRVGRVGFGMHWGAVCFFVDATDALFLPRRARLAQTLAGPFADAVIAGCLALTAWVIGPGPAAALLLQVAGLNWMSVLLNLSPVLELDGQRALEDLLDEPDLHRSSLAAITHVRKADDRRTLLLAVYGLAAIVVGAVALLSSVRIWLDHYLPIVRQSLNEGAGGRIAALVFVGPTVAAVVVWLAHRVVAVRRRG
jgi:Zn-dependent protease